MTDTADSMGTVEVTEKIALAHGLNSTEWALACNILERTPSFTELGVFSVMWSEHCSYKSSKAWLKRLPTTGSCVICGPGENAGVVDIGDGLAAVFKIESHNHPSFIEPVQGASTGVGGILRDVFTMGARPIAILNALRLGDPSHPSTRRLLAGIVSGIGTYGNCVGVPTVGGELNFHPSYNGNCLVNAMAVGVAPAGRIFYARAAGVGNPVVYAGSPTGRDGIHGATMASAGFTSEASSMRPTVQVGDPFTGKLLIEACLELMATDAIVAIQDMGAAGLTSSSVEMAARGSVGITLELDQVPQREPGMTAYDIMLSESQERMLMVLRPGAEDQAAEIFKKWNLDFVTIGQLTDTGRLVVRHQGQVAADIPVPPLVDRAPVLNRPHEVTPPRPPVDPALVALNDSAVSVLCRMLALPDLASRRWVWEQYDHSVGANTIAGPGGDAAVVRLTDSGRALTMTCDVTPRYCFASPIEGGRQAVAEAWRNLTAVGSRPLAFTNNLNFGNPEIPRIMGQLAGVIEGMADAGQQLGFPVVSGNVSLYNETDGQAILPTPTIGGLGLLEDVTNAVGIAFDKAGLNILVLGAMPNPGAGHLGQSLYLRDIKGLEDGPPPPVDLTAEKRTGDFVRDIITSKLVRACHDVSDGGLLVAVAEMTMSGRMGATLNLPADAATLFGEDQGRYVVTSDHPDDIERLAASRLVPVTRIGHCGGDLLTGPSLGAISVGELLAVHESWLPALMQESGNPPF